MAPPRTTTVKLHRSVPHPQPGGPRATPEGSLEVLLEGLSETSDAMRTKVRKAVAEHASEHESRVLVSNVVDGGFVVYLPAHAPTR